MEAEVAGPGLVADQRDAARVGELGDARDVRHDAEPGRLDEQDGARVRLGLERGLDRLDGMAERDAARLVDGGGDPDRSRAREHEAGRDRLVRAARDDHRLALGGDREAERLVGVRRAVAREAAEIGAEGRRGEPLGARADALAAAQVVRAAVHRRVVGEQRVVADQRRVALVPRRRERRRRLAQERIHRIGEGCLGGASRRETLCELCQAEQQHGLAVDDLAALDHRDGLGERDLDDLDVLALAGERRRPARRARLRGSCR